MHFGLMFYRRKKYILIILLPKAGNCFVFKQIMIFFKNKAFIYEVCPEGIQPYNMKNRDIY